MRWAIFRALELGEKMHVGGPEKGPVLASPLGGVGVAHPCRVGVELKVVSNSTLYVNTACLLP